MNVSASCRGYYFVQFHQQIVKIQGQRFAEYVPIHEVAHVEQTEIQNCVNFSE